MSYLQVLNLKFIIINRFPIFKSENFREKVKPSKVTMEDSRIENKSIENKKFLLFYTNSYIMPENH